MKLFSIGVKELFEPIVLHKKGDGFLLFLKAYIFLRNRSFSNAVEKCIIGKGNLSLTEIRLSINEIQCAPDNHNNMCHVCAKELKDVNFNQAVYLQNINS